MTNEMSESLFVMQNLTTLASSRQHSYFLPAERITGQTVTFDYMLY